MKLLERLNVAFKILVILTGFCIAMLVWPNQARAQYPSASFTSNVFTGCPPLSVDFVNMSTQSDSYLWDFGNGNTSTQQDPTTVYLTSGFYTVRLIAINTLTGNRDTLVATNYINVVTTPVSDFTATPLSGCIGNHSISFTNLSANATNYIWDFGDGTFSTQANPTHTYTNTGVYTVKLIARNSFNCSNLKIRPAYIHIVPNPAAAFTVNQQSSCNINQVFNFTCTTPGSVGWQWNFGDGSTSTLQNPSHTYGVQGSFNVSLIVTNPNGCTDTLIQPAYINIGASLVPSFTVNSQTGCAPYNASFNCTVPNATSWLWDFGDGNTSTLQNPSNLYNNPGSYGITLTVTTASGCNGSVFIPAYITVDQIPVPSFTVANPTGCKPLTTTFTNTSTNGITYLWDFGNGNTSTAFSPSNQYLTAGTYNVSLTATSANGCSATVSQVGAVTVNSVTSTFTATPRYGCAPLPVAFTGTNAPGITNWQWNFGDGFTGTGQLVNHTYVTDGFYNVSLIVTSSAGCKDTLVASAFIKIYPDSVPYTVPDTIMVCTPPGVVNFTCPVLGSNTWSWNFGDGGTSTVKNPSHTYTVPGIYTVTHQANMPGGCTQLINPYAIINVLPLIVSPITSVVVTPCGPYTVNFNNGTLNIASYLWDLGDGTTSTLQNPVHTYTNPGTYTITLLLISINGCQTSLSTTITVGHQNPITVSDDDICLGDAINFGLNPANAFASAVWNFGDGTTSNQLQPSHTYLAEGSYNVSVTVTDTSGCVVSFNYANPILISNPVPLFTVNQPTSGCKPFIVQFTNNSTGALSYSWDFGDGGTSTATSPSYTYNTAGTYTVSLTTTANGCVKTLTQTNLITVNEALVNFSFTPTSGCLPLTVNFTDLSINPVSWLWNFGDGNFSNVQNPVHIYTAPPTISVRLTIVDINGCTSTKSKVNIAPIYPDIIVDDSTGCKPLLVHFSTTLAANSYLWDFGDGTTSASQNPSHTYTQFGLYTVSLTCVLASGCTTTTVKPDFINVSSPVSDFMSPTVAVCAPSLVNFVNQSTGATSYLWDFGDGTTSTNSDPSHIYNVPGTYTVSLISTSGAGCSDTLVKVDYITVPGTLSDFTMTSLSTCQQTYAEFVDQSINATSWFWNFGDGFTSTLQNPTHVYADTGSYTVTLITSDSVGCTSFYSAPNPVVVYPNPVASGSVTTTNGCSALTTTFSNSSTGASNYMWYFGNGDSSSAANPTYTYTTPGTYLPSLVAITSFGCTDTIFMPVSITVDATPVADFLPGAISGCEPLTVTLTNLSSPLVNPVFAWDFGNGQTSSLQDPVVTYNIPGNYAVQLIVVNTGGCTDTIVQNITVLPTPVAAASASSYVGCAPLPVSFNNTSTGASTYLWDFGDGSTSSATNPNHTFVTGGNYQVTLIATGANGCSDTLIFPTSITVNATPVADFTTTPLTGCAPVTVTINNTSSLLNNPTFNWDFGNGTTSTQQNIPPVVYDSAGIYNITLIVTNSGGCADTITKSVTVNAIPVLSASANSVVGCNPFAVNFTNSTTGASVYLWNFGDGSTSAAANPSHTYSVPGTYTVSLVATSSSGCTDSLVLPSTITVNQTPVANFVRNPSSGCSPVTVTFNNTSTQLNNAAYNWDFGDGTSSTLQNNPPLVYSTPGVYAITLIVTNTGGCADTITKNVTIKATPVAAGTISDSIGCSPLAVTFTNNSTGANTYQWNFGDGSTSVSASPVHSYTTAGTYNVTLIASSNNGCSDTLYFSTPILVNPTPVADFTRTPVSGCIPVNVSFANNSSSLTSPVYNWDFGNGQTSSLQDPVMSYTTAGVYPVTLIVTNAGGCTDTIVKNITAFDLPVASAAISDSIGCSPLSVTFTNNSTGANSYQWNFGDGSTSVSASPVHSYTTAGTYNVSLIATSADGCNDTLYLSTPVIINTTPVADYTSTPVSGCIPVNVSFTNNSSSLASPVYNWDFGNGQSSSLQDPVMTFTTAGVYPVSLIVTNSGGCTDTIIKNITAFDLPVASAIVSDTSGCNPMAVNFTNTSTNAASYSWNFGDGNTSNLLNPSHNYTLAGNYTVSLIATSANGCVDTLVFPFTIDVLQSPVANFTRTPASGCSPLNVFFNSTSTQLSNPVYSWDFGNGQTGNQPSANILFSAAGTFPVTLTVTNDNGCVSNITKNVIINQTPDAIATISGNSGCAPYSVTFTNNSIAATSYLWNFGDGTTSTVNAPVHTYNNPGDYTVTLVVTGAGGCSDTLVFNPFVHVKTTPSASFSTNVVSGCSPLAVVFTDQSTSLDSPAYSWNFGNGQNSTSQNPSVVYNAAGTFTVNQIVTNAEGCSDTASATLTVNPLPLASATVSASTGCSPMAVTFQNLSTGASGYLWNFGDNSTSTTPSPIHTYTTSGSFTVTLIATSQFGCKDTFVFASPVIVNQTPVAAFSQTSQGGCTPVNINFVNQSTMLSSPVYSWNLGNGQTGSSANMNGSYTTGGVFPVTLIVTNSGGCSDTSYSTITTYSDPVAIASTHDTVGCTPHNVTFTNNSINGASYLWNFGDGSTSAQQTPTHTYSAAGNYTVTLIVQGAGTCADTLVLPYNIHVKATPSASFGPAAVTGCTPLNVSFNNTSTGLVGPSFSWNFGNGSSSIIKDPSVTYNLGGTFGVVLIVTNNEGCSDTAFASVNANLSPVAQASLIDTMGCAPHQILFNSSSLFATSVLWNFGDGNTSTLANVPYTYNTPGNYTPYLVAYSAAGCSDTAFFASPVHVNPYPVAAFTVNQTASCSGTTFQFQSQSTPTTGLTYNWNIGGNIYTVQNPSVPIMNPGFYNVSLIVTNQFGCSDTVDEPNYIQVYDTLPPPATPILSVSVLNNTSVEITWQNSSVLDLGAYVLYRLNTVSGIYDEIYRDITPDNSSISISSTYVDNGLSTLQNVYTYKLLAVDRCAYSLPLSALNPHTTINVTATAVNANVRVDWSRYLGCSVSSYEINRVNLSDGTSSLIATVPPNTLTYLDQGFYCPDEYSYRITATSLCGNTYTSLSDTSIAVPSNPLAGQKVEIVRSTVIDDKDVLTEWLPPVIAPNRVIQYNVMRSTDNVNYSEVASLPASALSYVDYNTDVHNQDYFYRIDVVSDCELTGSPSNNGASILLKSDWEHEKTKLWWTPYTDWNTGVDYYIIEQEDPFGQWVPVKTVDGNELNTILDQ